MLILETKGGRIRRDESGRWWSGGHPLRPPSFEQAERRTGRCPGYPRWAACVDTVDYLIAAAAQKLEARLLTQSVRHFPMFPDLQPAY